MAKEIEKKTAKIEKLIEFPFGSKIEINKYLSEQEDLFNLELPSYACIQSGEYVLKAIFFDHKWCGYEDHDFFVVAEIEESDSFYQKRLSNETEKRIMENELRIKKEEENKAKRRAERLEEIKKLKEKLAELERTNGL